MKRYNPNQLQSVLSIATTSIEGGRAVMPFGGQTLNTLSGVSGTYR